MKFGLMYHVESPDSIEPSRLYDVLRHQAVLGDQLGFEWVWFAEHHFGVHKSFMPQPLFFALDIAARTTRIATGTAVICLPLHNPLDIAEQVATAEVLSGGRLQVGFGSGSSPLEFARFGVPQDERRTRFREGLRVVLDAWKGEPFTFSGTHYTIEETTIRPRPLQKPGDFAWLGASSPESSRLAGELGLNVAYPRGHAAPYYADLASSYRDGRASAGHDPATGKVSISRCMYVAPTRTQALADAGEAVRSFQRRFRHSNPTIDPEGPLDELIARLNFTVGDPDDCIAIIRELRDVGGSEHLTVLPTWEDLDPEKVESSMRLFAREVMPHFEETPSP